MLRCLISFFFVTVLGCSSSTPPSDQPKPENAQELPPANGAIPQCIAYENDPKTFGYCLYKFAGGFPSIQEVDRLCPMAGEWEKDCRHAWVSGRMNSDTGYTTEVLLDVCQKNPDCTFELLDFRPDPDVVKQINYCVEHVGPYTRDCIGHAMQRWWYTKPNAEEVARVAKISTPFPDRVAFYIAASVACSTIGTCDGDVRMTKVCEKTAQHYKQYPKRCPAQEEKPMHGNLKPEQLRSKTGQSKPQKPVQKHGPSNGAKPPHIRPPSNQNSQK
jgi:hypothetical protein